jgi:lipoprotein-releasing system ATP-binding protein
MNSATLSVESRVGTASRMGDQNTSIAGPLMEVRGLKKSYRRGATEVPVLRGVDLKIPSGELTAIVGQSGSGKSTLLHLLATLDTPDDGEIHYEGNRIDRLNAAGRDVLRNHHFGMVFQFYHLLPELTALENVMLPLLIRCSVFSFLGQRQIIKKTAIELLDRMRLSHRTAHLPTQMSGGEMQRVAIARALMPSPRILFADEPTGNLDQETGEGILDLLSDLRRDWGITIVMVTHDQSIAARATRIVRLVEGRIA